MVEAGMSVAAMWCSQLLMSTGHQFTTAHTASRPPPFLFMEKRWNMEPIGLRYSRGRPHRASVP